jgi:hypothetical protein
MGFVDGSETDACPQQDHDGVGSADVCAVFIPVARRDRASCCRSHGLSAGDGGAHIKGLDAVKRPNAHGLDGNPEAPRQTDADVRKAEAGQRPIAAHVICGHAATTFPPMSADGGRWVGATLSAALRSLASSGHTIDVNYAANRIARPS